jgi:uncharacterized protein YkwD
MKVVLRAMIVLSLIMVALAVSWYPWRDPKVDTGTSQLAPAPEPPPIEALPQVSTAPSAPAAARPDPRAGRSARDRPTMSAADRALADQVLRLVNVERARAKCPAVRPDAKLATAALLHSDDMADRRYLNHNSPEGVDPWQRARAAGYPAPTGENIAIGYPNAAAVMAGWLTSTGHRATIVNCRARALGVGVARNTDGTPYWTQLFGA